MGPYGELPLTVQTSTGLAAGQTFEEAVVAGICEVLERDAFIVAWQNRLSVPVVPLDSRELGWLRELLMGWFAWPRIDYLIGDVTPADGFPTYVAVSKGPSTEGPIVSFGAATDLSGRTALVRAVLKAAMGRVYVKGLVRDDASAPRAAGTGALASFADHAQFYTRHPAYWRDLASFFRHRAPADLARLSAEQPRTSSEALPSLLAAAAAGGRDVVCRDLTTEDIRGAGLHVVRVLIPGMQLLHGDHRLPFLGGRRLLRPAALFPALAQYSRGFPNPYPHPYP